MWQPSGYIWNFKKRRLKGIYKSISWDGPRIEMGFDTSLYDWTFFFKDTQRSSDWRDANSTSLRKRVWFLNILVLSQMHFLFIPLISSTLVQILSSYPKVIKPNSPEIPTSEVSFHPWHDRSHRICLKSFWYLCFWRIRMNLQMQHKSLFLPDKIGFVYLRIHFLSAKLCKPLGYRNDLIYRLISCIWHIEHLHSRWHSGTVNYAMQLNYSCILKLWC